MKWIGEPWRPTFELKMNSGMPAFVSWHFPVSPVGDGPDLSSFICAIGHLETAQGQSSLPGWVLEYSRMALSYSTSERSTSGLLPTAKYTGALTTNLKGTCVSVSSRRVGYHLSPWAFHGDNCRHQVRVGLLQHCQGTQPFLQDGAISHVLLMEPRYCPEDLRFLVPPNSLNHNVSSYLSAFRCS